MEHAYAKGAVKVRGGTRVGLQAVQAKGHSRLTLARAMQLLRSCALLLAAIVVAQATTATDFLCEVVPEDTVGVVERPTVFTLGAQVSSKQHSMPPQHRLLSGSAGREQDSSMSKARARTARTAPQATAPHSGTPFLYRACRKQAQTTFSTS